MTVRRGDSAVYRPVFVVGFEPVTARALRRLALRYIGSAEPTKSIGTMTTFLTLAHF